MKQRLDFTIDIPLYSIGSAREEIKSLYKFFDDRDTLGGVSNRHVPAMESKFEKITSRAASAVNSCTNGIYLTLKKLGLNGDPVLIPSIIFFGVAGAVVRAGGIPIFMGVDTLTGCLNIDEVNSIVDSGRTFFGKKPKAVITAFMNGRYIDTQSISDKITVIEDAAASFGMKTFDDRCVISSTSNISIISFSFAKPLTAGEGGVIFSNDADAKWFKGHRYCGLDNLDGMYGIGGFEVNDQEIKFPFFAMGAALIMIKLKKFEAQLKRRAQIANYFESILGQHQMLPFYYGNNHLTYALSLNTPEIKTRVQQHLTDKGIGCYSNHGAVFKFSAFKDYPRIDNATSTSEEYFNRILHIPCRHDLTDDQVANIAETVRGCL